MNMALLRTALVYDFDGTLARGNIQERTFIPSLGMKKQAFWDLVGERARATDSDEILIYMMMMMEKAREHGTPLTAAMLKEHGKEAELFSGLSGSAWFTRINEFAAELGLHLEHYIISSGIQEMIEGCPIYKNFSQVFASKFLYDRNGEATWPGVAINYTTKTQFLFRINKGVNNTWNNNAVNEYRPEQDRPVPFKRMIFIGDGDTDIPSMKMTTHQGGHSIAVYDPKRDAKVIGKVHRLIADGRVNFVAPADYEENSHLDIIIKGILGRLARDAGARRPDDVPDVSVQAA